MKLVKHNQKAWDKKVEDGVVYTKPVSSETIEKAKAGEWEITVTTERPVPRSWFPSSLKGIKVLCLASGGGQQAPVLAAAGADVSVVDISDMQLEQDRFVAERGGLYLDAIQGDMSDLYFFEDGSFDLIVHPVSNVFVESILPVWKETYRVLKNGGTLIAGFTNPLLYLFDDDQEEKGILDVKHSIPFSGLTSISEEELQCHVENNRTVEFGHTLEEQIQGQIDAGYVITGFYEDDFGGKRLIDNYIKTFIATKAVKI
ncbi:Methyltransferase domain-containing protein [Thalassobacillus cyri]|uniref:Methyltransferase domain-containing protein n=1 Tax=Thalassobacillus cyri TaxID=571932 RepID=A0A1H3ZSX1_9BACI|nr:class I SAM-dependent methyltransferase [Thalassobacillus cyri]SEA26799.1 Methyltransferase domain-containing protein [Thalassobacillus cyri]